VNVSWNDCQEFIAWANKQSGAKLRLPTEAEWEYAARGGFEGWEYPWEGGMDDSKLWYTGTSGDKGTASVSRDKNVFVNGYGLVDMGGNVWQWCSDYYAPYRGDETNPTGPKTGGDRVLRGGSWFSYDADIFRCARRDRSDPADRWGGGGFRCASPGP
jgi:formylglycine-generating enzyme required for sulfatase activity